MTHATRNLSVKPTDAYWGAGTAKMLHKGDLVTDEAPSTVEAAGYLNASARRLPKGTIIDAVMNHGQATPIAKKYVVTGNDGTNVTIAVLETGAGGGVSPVVVLQKDMISSKASDAAVHRWVAPFKGKVNRIRTVLNDVLATANATVQVKINGADVTGALATITSVGAAGDVDEGVATAANTFVAGDVISILVGGGSTATGTLNAQVEIEETA